MSDTAQMILLWCGAVVTVSGALGAIFGVMWWLVKPRVTEWVHRELVDPVRETHHQVTVNHHSSEEPTVLDKIADVSTQMTHVAEQVTDVAAQNAQQNRRLTSIENNVQGLTVVTDDLLRRHLEQHPPVGDEPDLD